MSDEAVAASLASEVLLSCTVEDGKLKMLEPAFLALGKRVHEAVDKTVWATVSPIFCPCFRASMRTVPTVWRIEASGRSRLNAISVKR